jgi:hypothetical protein
MANESASSHALGVVVYELHVLATAILMYRNAGT